MVAFSVYRLVLSQRENHMLLFIIIALIILLRYFKLEGEKREIGQTRPGSISRAARNELELASRSSWRKGGTIGDVPGST